jgi:putative acetyltransferase
MLQFIVPAEYTSSVRTLLREYIAGLGIDMAFQNVDAELAVLPGERYCAENGGAIFILHHARTKQLVGCIALKDLGDGIAEAKRLFVRSAYRGLDLGRLLLLHIIDVATQAGYSSLRLDTLARFTAANQLYAQLGFKQIAAYNYHPEADIVYFELANLKEAAFKKGREELYAMQPRVARIQKEQQKKGTE